MLYRGPLELVAGDDALEGEGNVNLSWFPVPSIRFQFSRGGTGRAYGMDEVMVRLAGGRMEGRALVTQTSGDFDRVRLEGVFPEPIEWRGEEKPHLDHVLFHLPNFQDYYGSEIGMAWGSPRRGGSMTWRGRMVLDSSNWRVTLDSLPDGRERCKAAEAERGFAFTHVGKLERADGRSFTPEEAEPALQALRFLFSFMRGMWTGPALLVGYAGHERAWEKWATAYITSENVWGWMPYAPGYSLDILDGFLQRWEDTTWQEPLRLAVHWYVEANRAAGGLDGAIILAMTALELLAWTWLFDEKQVEKSEKKFDGLHADQRMRQLLNEAGIPAAIPPELAGLVQAAKAEQWSDGPGALNGLRNSAVHPRPKHRKVLFGTSVDARADAWKLALWYVELVLLRVLGYTGTYWNRTNGRQGADYEHVPWAATTASQKPPAQQQP